MAPGFAGKPAGLFRLGYKRGLSGNILIRVEKEKGNRIRKRGDGGGGWRGNQNPR